MGFDLGSAAGDFASGALGSLASGAINFGFGQASAALNSRRAWKYYKRQKALDYAYDANQYFNLNRRYAENSALWQTTGLRAAGLNPILAATSGSFANAPTISGSTAGQVDTSSGNSPSIDINEGIRDFASAKQAKSAATLADVEAKNAKQLVNADLDIKQAQAEQIRANTDKIKADTTSAKGSTNNILGTVREAFDGLSNSTAKQLDNPDTPLVSKNTVRFGSGPTPLTDNGKQVWHSLHDKSDFDDLNRLYSYYLNGSGKNASDSDRRKKLDSYIKYFNDRKK